MSGGARPGDAGRRGPGGRAGLFLVFEGIEGAGKTTQVRLFSEWLESRGILHLVTREPGGTAIGEEIRRLLLMGDAVPDRTELLLMLAARAAIVETRIVPALAEGRIVVADRSPASASTNAVAVGKRSSALLARARFIAASTPS